jgi:hypothetical protein
MEFEEKVLIWESGTIPAEAGWPAATREVCAVASVTLLKDRPRPYVKKVVNAVLQSVLHRTLVLMIAGRACKMIGKTPAAVAEVAPAPPQSAESVPRSHMLYSEPGPPSSQSSSLDEEHVLVQPALPLGAGLLGALVPSPTDVTQSARDEHRDEYALA